MTDLAILHDELEAAELIAALENGEEAGEFDGMTVDEVVDFFAEQLEF